MEGGAGALRHVLRLHPARLAGDGVVVVHVALLIHHTLPLPGLLALRKQAHARTDDTHTGKTVHTMKVFPHNDT